MALDQFGNYNGPGQRFGVGVQTKRGAIGFNLTPEEAARSRRMALAASLGVQNVQGVENYAEPQIMAMGNQRREQEYEQTQRANVMQERAAAERRRTMEEDQARQKKMEYLKGLGGGKPPSGMSPVEWESVIANSPDLAEKMFMSHRTNALNDEQMALKQREREATSKRVASAVLQSRGISDPEVMTKIQAIADSGGSPAQVAAAADAFMKERQQAAKAEMQAQKDQIRAQADAEKRAKDEAKREQIDRREAARILVEQEETGFKYEQQQWQDELSYMRKQAMSTLDPDEAAAINIKIADLERSRPKRDRANAARDAYREAFIRAQREGADPGAEPKVSDPQPLAAPASSGPISGSLGASPGGYRIRAGKTSDDTPVQADQPAQEPAENPTYRTDQFPGGGPMYVAEEPEFDGYKTAGAVMDESQIESLRATAAILKSRDPEAYNKLAAIIRGPHTEEQLRVAIDEANKIALKLQERTE